MAISPDTHAQSLSEGAHLPQKKILENLKSIKVSAAGATATEIQDGIRQNLDAVFFDKHNQAGIVEARATFKATRGTDKLFELEIIWGMSKTREKDGISASAN